MYIKLTAVLLVFFGEAFSIGAELIASKRVAAQPGDYFSIFLLMFVPIIIGGALLVGGYMLGYIYVKNIWIIAAVSVGSILIVEPLMILALFHEMPTAGALTGLILGAFGILFALFW